LSLVTTSTSESAYALPSMDGLGKLHTCDTGDTSDTER
jgi:hypothetical protein